MPNIEEMTRTEKLDKILNGLLYTDMRRLNNEPVNKKVTIEWLFETLELDCEKWEMTSLKNELIDKKLIKEFAEELYITEKGKHFITREKGFRQLDKVADQEDVIRQKTIEKFKYDKISFWISIIALIIAGLSLLMTMTKQ